MLILKGFIFIGILMFSVIIISNFIKLLIVIYRKDTNEWKYILNVFLIVIGIFGLVLSIYVFKMFDGLTEEEIKFIKPDIKKIIVKNNKAHIYIEGRKVVIEDKIACLKKENIWIKKYSFKDSDNNFELLVCEKE